MERKKHVNPVDGKYYEEKNFLIGKKITSNFVYVNLNENGLVSCKFLSDSHIAIHTVIILCDQLEKTVL